VGFLHREATPTQLCHTHAFPKFRQLGNTRFSERKVAHNQTVRMEKTTGLNMKRPTWSGRLIEVSFPPRNNPKVIQDALRGAFPMKLGTRHAFPAMRFRHHKNAYESYARTPAWRPGLLYPSSFRGRGDGKHVLFGQTKNWFAGLFWTNNTQNHKTNHGRHPVLFVMHRLSAYEPRNVHRRASYRHLRKMDLDHE
jgi:hypothetical protein